MIRSNYSSNHVVFVLSTLLLCSCASDASRSSGDSAIRHNTPLVTVSPIADSSSRQGKTVDISLSVDSGSGVSHISSPILIRTDLREKGVQRMRCWQNGKLIYEKMIKELPVEAKASRRVIAADNGADIHVFDFQNAICSVD